MHERVPLVKANANPTSHEFHEHGAGRGGGQDLHFLLRGGNLFSPFLPRREPGLHRSQLSKRGQRSIHLLRSLKKQRKSKQNNLEYQKRWHT